MKLLFLILYMTSGLIMMILPQIVLYLLVRSALTLWRPMRDDLTILAVLVTGGIGAALMSALLFLPSEPLDGIFFSVKAVALTGLVWIPLGDLIWRRAARLCPCGA